MIKEIKNIKEIEEVIISYANGKFNRRLPLTGMKDDIDILLAGINMLGEELETTTISRDYFSNIYNSVSDLLIVTNLLGQIIDANTIALNTFNIPIEDIVSKSIKELLNDSIEPELSVSDFLENKQIFEAKIVNEKIILNCTISKIHNKEEEHVGFLIKAKDITAQKERAQAELKITIESQEKERLRLAYDLHDALGQEINALKMFMSSLTYMDKSSAEFTETITSCKELIDNSVEVIRNITFNLMPKALEKGGVLIAINELTKKISPFCQVHYNMPDYHLSLSSENQIMLYRIVQEFINNSLKHSKCTRISISISKVKDKIFIGLYDNGIGFDFDNIEMGNGLLNITYRLNALKATYKMTSKIKRGTSLEIALSDETN